MEIVKTSSDEVLNFLGGHQRKRFSVDYRLCKYVVTTESLNKIAIHNTLTGFIGLMTKYEYDHMMDLRDNDTTSILIENYCIVPQDFKEEEYMLQYRQSKNTPITSTYLNNITNYTIFTTTQCNARCFYCYEKGIKDKKPMTLETAEKIVNYMLVVSFSDSTLHLGWFGGEPLYNAEVIDYICNKLEEIGRPYSSSMISNSYLFSDWDLVTKAVEKWKLTNIQVTLDGTEEVYNKTKRFIYKDDPNPFATVIKAIHNLIDHNVRVSVRLNCDLHNIDNLSNLVDFLAAEFGETLHAYAWPIFEIKGYKRTPEQREELFKKLKTFNQKLIDYGMMDSPGINYGPTYKHCMVDNGNSVTILPDGKIGLCEHYSEDDFIGDITYPDKIDLDIAKTWRDYILPGELCHNCPISPICFKTRKCPSSPLCDIYEKDYKIDRAKKDLNKHIIDTLRDLGNQNSSCNCCKENFN